MPKILDQWGKPIDRQVLDAPQTARVASLTNTYLTPALDGLTPSRLSVALREADNGNLIAQHRIFADMEERDAHILCEMNKRKLAVLQLDWSIVPPSNATAAEKADAEWLTEVLKDAVDPLEDLIMALMDGVGHGFAPVELEWRNQGKYWLPAFFPRPQEWFRLDATRSEIRLIDCSADGAKLDSFGWVWHTHGKAKTGYMGRMGLYRALVWPFIYKAYAIGDFAEFLETFGLPFIIGKYFAGATPDEKASLLRAVTALGHDARAIMSTDMQVEISKVIGSGGSSPHLAMVDWAERSQSKAILGQTTSSEAKATGMGSGMADFHAEVRRDIRNADARQIAATITRDLLYPLLALNRGGVSLDRCPSFRFDTGEAEDLKAYAESLPKLVGIGFQIPLEWAQDKLRIPQPKDGQAVLSVANPALMLPPAERPITAPEAALAALSAQAADQIPATSAPASITAQSERLTGTAGAAFNVIVAQIEDLAANAIDLADLRDKISSAFPMLKGDAFAALMSEALIAADLAGRWDIMQEAGGA